MIIDTFQLVRYLTGYPIKLYRNTFLSTRSTNKLRRYFEKLNYENVLIITYSPNGKTTVKKCLFGDTHFWDDLNLLENKLTKKNKTQVTFIPITFTEIFNEHNTITIGYLCIKNSQRFVSQEFEALQTLASIIGDLCQKRLQETFRIESEEFQSKIFDYTFSDKKAGTIIFQWIYKLYKAFDPLSAYYLTLYNHSFAVEYYKRDPHHTFISNKTHLNSIDNSIYDKISIERNSSFFLFGRKCPGFTSIIHRFDRTVNESTCFYFHIVKKDDFFIGAWIFAYSHNQSIPTYFLKSNLELLNKSIGNNFNYLFQRRTNHMIVDPIFKNRNTLLDNKSVFILMPFTLEWSDRIFKKILKPTIEAIDDLKVKRADDFFGADIMEDIWSNILSARFIIADISERNPNVFYELGLCHCLGKEVILITQNIADIPFDLNRYRHIIYKDNLDGYELLQKQLTGKILDILSAN